MQLYRNKPQYVHALRTTKGYTVQPVTLRGALTGESFEMSMEAFEEAYEASRRPRDKSGTRNGKPRKPKVYGANEADLLGPSVLTS